jgi:hypothetical protein
MDARKKLIELAEGLTPLEAELISGAAKGWGSWMFACGSGLVAKGLAEKRGGSIIFNELGNQVGALIRARAAMD